MITRFQSIRFRSGGSAELERCHKAGATGVGELSVFITFEVVFLHERPQIEVLRKEHEMAVPLHNARGSIAGAGGRAAFFRGLAFGVIELPPQSVLVLPDD